MRLYISMASESSVLFIFSRFSQNISSVEIKMAAIFLINTLHLYLFLMLPVEQGCSVGDQIWPQKLLPCGQHACSLRGQLNIRGALRVFN